MFKKIMIGAAAVGLALASVSAADAAGGCGRGFHRGPHGRCRPNEVVAGPAALVIGTFFWAIMFLNVLWAIGGTDLSAAQTAVGALVVGAIAGPTIALALRRRVRRGEAAA